MHGRELTAAARHRSARRVSRTKKLVAVVSATCALLGIGGAAFGYQVDGTGAAGGSQALTVRQTSTVTGLAPGSGAQRLSGNFDNHNAGPAYVTAVSAAVAEVNDASGQQISGCTADDFRIAGTGAVKAPIPAGDGRGSWGDLTIEFNSTGANQDACKQAHVVIGYTVS
jgi:hypothetical protein